MVLITIVIGAYKPTNITGRPHIVDIPLQPVLRMPCRPEVVPELKEMAEDASKGASSFFVVTRREISTTDVFLRSSRVSNDIYIYIYIHIMFIFIYNIVLYI